MTKKTRILIVHHGQGLGGALIALVGLINELKESYSVSVLCVFDSSAVAYLRSVCVDVDVQVARTLFFRRLYRLFIHSEASYPSIIDSTRKVIALGTTLMSRTYFAKAELRQYAKCCDIVYLNSTFLADWAPAARGLGKHVVIHVREPLTRGIFGIRRHLIRHAIATACHKVVCVSKDNSSRMNLPAISTVVYDPVMIRGRCEGARLSEFEDSEAKCFLYLGGTQRIKGFEQLANSLSHLDRNIRIQFLGGNVEHAQSGLKRFVRRALDSYYMRGASLADKIRYSDRIQYFGLVENVFDHYSKCIAVICPFSKPHAALPILEAFAVGKPVIASDVDGMDELVDANNGLLFKNGDAASLAKAINSLARLSEREYSHLAQGARDSYAKIVSSNPTVTDILKGLTNAA